MNPEDLKNKEMLEINCSCGRTAYIFIDDFNQCYLTTCLNCHKKIYSLTCQKCQSGFAFPEDTKSINLIERWWRCQVCGFKNPLRVNECQIIKNYQEKELPSEILLKNKSVRIYKTKAFLLTVILLLIIILVDLFFRIYLK